MRLLVLGLNHKSAALDVRGRFAFKLDQLTPTLHAFRARYDNAPAHPEVALLSTCNRTELYCAADGVHLERGALDWLARIGGLDRRELMRHTYLYEGAEAARHAFRVASGLDSMVLGEPQILGQMKQAVREADTAGTLGTTLHRLFQRTFSIAKEVRSTTGIGSNSVSLAAASLKLAKRQFGKMGDCNILLVGAGDMMGLVAAHFAAAVPKRLAVVNRSPERAAKLARRVGAETFCLDDLPHRLPEFDVVISGTSSPVNIISAEDVERGMELRRDRPMLMIDLAMPRDIDPGVARLSDVNLFSLDDLSAVVRDAGTKRMAGVKEAEAIIEMGACNFVRWLDQRASVPLIKALQAQADGWRAAELARARKALSRGENVEAVLEKMSRGLAQKMLHGALAGLRAGDGNYRMQLASTVSTLFLGCPARNPALVPHKPMMDLANRSPNAASRVWIEPETEREAA